MKQGCRRDQRRREEEIIGRSIKVLSADAGEAYEELCKQTLMKQVFTSLPLSATRRDGSGYMRQLFGSACL